MCTFEAAAIDAQMSMSARVFLGGFGVQETKQFVHVVPF